MIRKKINIFLNKFYINRKNVFIDRDVKSIFEKEAQKDKVLEKYNLHIKDLEFIADKKNIKKYTFIQSMFLYKLLFTEGNVVEASKFRSEYLKFITQKKYKNFEEYFILVKALIDEGKIIEAYKLTSKFQFRLFFSINYYLSYIYIKNISFFLSKLINKKHKKFFNLNVIVGNIGEKDFKDHIKSKSIALVGPGYSNKKNGEEIDKFDLVIRLNLFNDYNNTDKKLFGSKTNIIYFNGEMYRKIEKNGISDFHRDKYLCSRLDFSDRYQLDHNRSTRKLNLNLSGTNGFIQDIIIDLMHYDFKKLKLFNIDFFLNKNLYFSDYSKQGDMKKHKMFLTQSKLDLFSNINFIRNLEKSGIIEVDEVLKNILAFSNLQIAKEFKHLYQSHI